MRDFDYIICGTGSAGSALAGRLSADKHLRILVVEAGGDDTSDIIDNPNRWPQALGTDLDWRFNAEPSSNLNDRAIPYGMGKVLGGGSSINVGTWSRGHRTDWDHFASESGDAVWAYDSVRQIFTESVEAWSGEVDPLRGRHGAMHIQPSADPHPFAHAILEAAESMGLERFPNANGGLMEAVGGCSIVDEIVRDGRRRSVYRSYLFSHSEQSNITILKNTLAYKIVFEGKRAVGVECVFDGKLQVFRAEREIILAAGAINTPKILMQSGIGEADALRSLGIPIVSDLAAVGANLHDHASFSCIWEASDRDLPPAPRSQSVSFWRTDDGLAAPDAYAYARKGASVSAQTAKSNPLPDATWSLVVGVRLDGRGRVSLQGAGPDDPVRISTGFMERKSDVAKLLRAVETARDIGNQPAMTPFTAKEVFPYWLSAPQVLHFLRQELGTFWHQCGTAKMGSDPKTSVVDGRLKVHGVDGLRVADASIFPQVTCGNTMAPCVLVGEMAAKFILDPTFAGPQSAQ